jgi:hypothetical protein
VTELFEGARKGRAVRWAERRTIAAAARLVGEQVQMIENGLILVTTFIAQQGRD